jgi:hypothetical protein
MVEARVCDRSVVRDLRVCTAGVFDGAALRRYYEEVNETEATGVEYAMLDGIAFFRDTLEPLESASVAVFVIG